MFQLDSRVEESGVLVGPITQRSCGSNPTSAIFYKMAKKKMGKWFDLFSEVYIMSAILTLIEILIIVGSFIVAVKLVNEQKVTLELGLLTLFVVFILKVLLNRYCKDYLI